jgi:hypothetical protein
MMIPSPKELYDNVTFVIGQVRAVSRRCHLQRFVPPRPMLTGTVMFPQIQRVKAQCDKYRKIQPRLRELVEQFTAVQELVLKHEPKSDQETTKVRSNESDAMLA